MEAATAIVDRETLPPLLLLLVLCWLARLMLEFGVFRSVVAVELPAVRLVLFEPPGGCCWCCWCAPLPPPSLDVLEVDSDESFLLLLLLWWLL